MIVRQIRLDSGSVPIDGIHRVTSDARFLKLVKTSADVNKCSPCNATQVAVLFGLIQEILALPQIDGTRLKLIKSDGNGSQITYRHYPKSMDVVLEDSFTLAIAGLLTAEMYRQILQRPVDAS